MEEFADPFKGFSEYYDLFFNSKEINLTDVKLISYLNNSEIVEVMGSENIKERNYIALLRINYFIMNHQE